MRFIGHKPSEQKSTVSAYEVGLKTSFAACNDPMPEPMQQVLARVQDMENHGDFGKVRLVKRFYGVR